MNKFKITEQDRTQAVPPLRPSEQQPYQVVKVLQPTTEVVQTKNEGEKVVLKFSYQDKSGRTHTQTEWPIDYGSKDELKIFGMLRSRLGHIYSVIGGNPVELGNIDAKVTKDPESIDEQREMFKIYFEQIVEDFKKFEEKLKGQYFWLLIHYTNSGEVSTPTIPNFLEVYVAGVMPTTLTIDKRYNRLTQPDVIAKASNPVNAGLPNVSGNTGFDIP